MSSAKDRRGDLESLLNAFLRQTDADEWLGESLADEIEAEAANEEVTPKLRSQALSAVRRGMFDGNVARARENVQGSLGAFGTALRRIREAARCSPEEMAVRAGIETATWEDLEEQRITADSIELEKLVNVVEAAQLRPSELRASLRAQSVRLLPGGQASFRADHLGASDTRAAHEDLLAALSDEAVSPSEGSGEDAIDRLVEEVADELRRRGRNELL